MLVPCIDASIRNSIMPHCSFICGSSICINRFNKEKKTLKNTHSSAQIPLWSPFTGWFKVNLNFSNRLFYRYTHSQKWLFEYKITIAFLMSIELYPKSHFWQCKGYLRSSNLFWITQYNDLWLLSPFTKIQSPL